MRVDALPPHGGDGLSTTTLALLMEYTKDRNNLMVGFDIQQGDSSMPDVDTGQEHSIERIASRQGDLRQRRDTRFGLEILARLRIPVVMVDAQRQVQKANPAARTLFAANKAVFVSGNRLCCRRPSDTRVLSNGLYTVLSHDNTPPVGQRTATLFVRARSSASDRGLDLYIDALRQAAEPSASDEPPLALIAIHDAQSPLIVDPIVVETAFGLTPAEARVAVGIAEGASPEEIASRRGASIHTVRCQVQTILHKTGKTRQAEIVGLLAGLPAVALHSSLG